MAEKVLALFGEPLPGETDPDLIAQAERFLAAVHRGEVRAFAIVYVRPNGHPSQSVKFDESHFYALHSGLRVAEQALTEIMAQNWRPMGVDEEPERSA